MGDTKILYMLILQYRNYRADVPE